MIIGYINHKLPKDREERKKKKEKEVREDIAYFVLAIIVKGDPQAKAVNRL